MRRYLVLAVVYAQVLLLWGCAAAWQNVSYSDDLYSIHNKIAIAERQKAEAELAKAQYEARQAQYEAAVAKFNAEASENGYTVITNGTVNGYDAVLADNYESAYARRLYGFSSPTYRMPSSYYTWRYSDAFFYASAYDPAFYNVVVSGDMVWVEPKYVTSMFGSWGATVIPSYSWYYGWDDPFYYWNTPYRYSYGWYYGWNNPYYWGWGCGYPYYHNHYHYCHHHYYPHHPSYHRPPHSGHNPPYAGSGSVGSTGHHQINRPGTPVGRNPGVSAPADRGEGGGRYTPTKPSTSVGRDSQPTYRVGGTSIRENKGSSSYRSSGSSSSGSCSGSSSPSYRSSGSSSSRSYSSPSSSSFNSARPSFSSGSSGGGSSSGGNSRGR